MLVRDDDGLIFSFCSSNVVAYQPAGDSLDCGSEHTGLPRWLWERIHLPMQETWLLSLGCEDLPGEGYGTPLQYSCLENPMDRGACGLHHRTRLSTQTVNTRKAASFPPTFSP